MVKMFFHLELKWPFVFWFEFVFERINFTSERQDLNRALKVVRWPNGCQVAGGWTQSRDPTPEDLAVWDKVITKVTGHSSRRRKVQ